ncbi:hypothetical protein [Actinomadura formosensis]|uniref:hypothetical protein n=1 Tax=Actinomadura formosensis TaxID=60706 RepID=UPI003D89F890
MVSKPLEQVTLADLATKDDLKDLATKNDIRELRQELKNDITELRQEFKQETGSAVNLLLGEIGKIAARQEEMAGHLARLVARSDGVMR